MYGYGNPVNLTDPSGFSPNNSQGINERDLTWWLYKELTSNANSTYVLKIKSLMAGTLENKKRGLEAFKYLVQDRAKWDFKHKIQLEFSSQAIVLLENNDGFRWYEYSVPGNIHYGFIGRAAGIPDWLLHAGASYAEIYDPAHMQRDIFGTDICCPCPDGAAGGVCRILLCPYLNPPWIVSGFDDPKDWNAVETGIQLFNSGGANISFTAFVSGMTTWGSSLDQPTIIPEWNWVNPRSGWPYTVGRFNGPREAEYEPMILSLLYP